MDNRIRQRPNFNMIFSSLRVLRGGVTSFAMPDYESTNGSRHYTRNDRNMSSTAARTVVLDGSLAEARFMPHATQEALGEFLKAEFMSAETVSGQGSSGGPRGPRDGLGQSLRLGPRDVHRVEDPTCFNLANAVFSVKLVIRDRLSNTIHIHEPRIPARRCRDLLDQTASTGAPPFGPWDRSRAKTSTRIVV
jgi:hypothetical protein